MNNFNSLFELFAVFNFAYVLSNDFTAALNSKIIGSFNNIQKDIETIRALINENYSYLTANQSSENDDLRKEVCRQLNEQYINISSEFDALKTKTDEFICSSGILPKFNHYCLLAGFYCVLFLLFIALGLDISYEHGGLLLIYNLLFIFILILQFWDKVKFYKCNYLVSTLSFILINAIFGVFCLFYTLNNSLYFQSFEYKLWLYPVNIIFSIGIACHHFVIYFFKALYLRNNIVNRKSEEIINFRSKCTEFGTTLKAQLAVVDLSKKLASSNGEES